ncbi:hypothetical protein RB195_007295 [Necator americanus]|uniref:G protein gamma domain-containing protein n=4 Tax=Strongyloidea TaxID=27829 RepID=A0ABR1BXV5_NECAM
MTVKHCQPPYWRNFLANSETIMDKSDMQRSVDSLRSQLNIERTPISQSATELRRYTETQEDPLVNPIDKKVNPWAEKSKCSVL